MQDARVQQALVLLDQELLECDRPTIVSASGESPSYLMGNRGGFVRLAIACLKAAGGERQEFRKQDWVRCQDYDWVLGGFEYDESADTYLAPDPRTKPWWKRKLGNALGLLILALVFVLIGIGFISVVHFAATHF
jgi:hypothetical protein